MGYAGFSPPRPRPRPELSTCAYCGCQYEGFRTKCDDGCGAPIRHPENLIEVTSMDSKTREFVAGPPNPVSMDWIRS